MSPISLINLDLPNGICSKKGVLIITLYYQCGSTDKHFCILIIKLSDMYLSFYFRKTYLRFLLLLTICSSKGVSAQVLEVNKFLTTLKAQSCSPFLMIKESLKQHDLIIFDDGIHSAKEPFDFYCQLVSDTSVSNKISYIFLEVFNTNSQIYLDAFFHSKTPDSLLLIKAFQDDYSGYGWRYQTYLELFNCIWQTNQSGSNKIKVIAVSPPIFWEGLKSRYDYETFQNSLSSRDYFMYQTIKSTMSEFKKGEKGLFLTNTRHAYKNIKDSTCQLYWNTNTFFNQRDPGKTFSIRIHNASISITQRKKDVSKITTEGLNEFDYKWVLPENGLWDSAFARLSTFPLAVSFRNTSFGKSKYIGNLMINVKRGTTQFDAYDALIVLKPYNKLNFSSTLNFIYTPDFKMELKRRIKLMQEENLNDFLKENEVNTLDEFIEILSVSSPVQKNNLIK